MAREMTPEQFEAAIRVFPKELRKEVKGAFRTVMGPARKAIRAELKSKGIGKALWGRGRKKKDGIPMNLKTRSARWSNSQQAWISGFELRSIAAMIEQGGKIKPHVIRPKKSKYLVFSGKGGETIFAKRVEHPGMVIRRGNFVNRIMQRGLHELTRGVREAIERTARRVFK